MANFKFVFFDVADTLLYKPQVSLNIKKVLDSYDHHIQLEELIYKHKILSEIITFPDRTSKSFYMEFNKELLLLLGIEPKNRLVEDIFKECTYLPWEPYPDTDILKDITVSKGIISNWNIDLEKIIEVHFPNTFDFIICSEEIGYRKPDTNFYNKILEFTHCSPQDILYIGDSVKLDIIPANSLGLSTLLIDRKDIFPNASVQRIIHFSEIVDIL